MQEQQTLEMKATFTDRLRVIFKGIIDPIGTFFNNLGIRPNTMTLLGLFGTAVGAYFLARGHIDRRYCVGGRLAI